MFDRGEGAGGQEREEEAGRFGVAEEGVEMRSEGGQVSCFHCGGLEGGEGKGGGRAYEGDLEAPVTRVVGSRDDVRGS